MNNSTAWVLSELIKVKDYLEQGRTFRSLDALNKLIQRHSAEDKAEAYRILDEQEYA